ncbi:MAG: MBL fold metallo-hydrolase [Nitrospiria bacterium]
MRVCILGSGSQGNSVFIESPQTRVLVDAGLNANQTKARLAQLGVAIHQLDAILLTHEHGDHSQGIKSISHQYPLLCYTNEKTRRACKSLGNVTPFAEFQAGESFTIKDILIYPFSVPHDAVDTVCFTLQHEEWKVGIATDFGMIVPPILEALKGSNILVLEFNHDLELLEKGPYHSTLKERIRSDYGHLSNDESATLLKKLLHPSLYHVYLAHLSKANNSHEIAFLTALKVIEEACHETANLHLTWQDHISVVASI